MHLLLIITINISLINLIKYIISKWINLLYYFLIRIFIRIIL